MDRKKAKIQNDISELQNKINDFNGKISAIQSIREELLEKQYSLRRQLENIDRTERTQELVNQVFSVRENNAQCVRLSMRTKTTKIMDDFVFHSKKNFLVFERVFQLVPSYRYVSLVVVKMRHDVNYKTSNLTMTDLKKQVGSWITIDAWEKMKKGDRLFPLYTELSRICKHSITDGLRIPFHIPCVLGGQTFDDQTGFGSEYYGEELVFEGKEYGETTKFLIIGAIVGYPW